MNRKTVAKIIGAILCMVALFVALYVGGWLMLVKGCIEVLKHTSIYKVIWGIIKVFLGFPIIEYYASIVLILGRSFINYNEEIN